MDDEMLAVWPDGMLRCEINSPTRRLARGSGNTHTQTYSSESTPDVHVMCVVHPEEAVSARFDMRRETERRLLFDLVEHGIKEGVWPIAPEVRWRVYDARSRQWNYLSWPPDPRDVAG